MPVASNDSKTREPRHKHHLNRSVAFKKKTGEKGDNQISCSQSKTHDNDNRQVPIEKESNSRSRSRALELGRRRESAGLGSGREARGAAAADWLGARCHCRPYTKTASEGFQNKRDGD